MEMQFIQQLFNGTNFETIELENIKSVLKSKKFSAKTVIVPLHQKSEDLFIIVKGSIRKYCIKDGQEITIYIATEGQFAVEYVSFMSGNRSQNILETIEECDVLILKKRDLEDLYISIPKINEAMRKILERILLESQNRLNEFIVLSPEERYIKLIENNASLLYRIPQYILASYLGISATSLSRIRKRISSK
jgi:CRP-like cAMP-binding protein